MKTFPFDNVIFPFDSYVFFYIYIDKYTGLEDEHDIFRIWKQFKLQ